MKTILKNYLMLLSVAVLGGMATLGGYKFFIEEDAPRPEVGFVENKLPTMQVGEMAHLGSLPELTVAASVSTPAVVHVKSNFMLQTRQNNLRDPFGFFNDDFFFGRPRSRQVQSSGSGVITSPDGYIVTNNHVIRDAQKVEVILEDGRSYDAQIVGTDPSTDLALLKIDEQDLAFLSFGSSDDLQVGEWVLAVGNPFNLTSTVTAGIVSAKARDIQILKDRLAIESFIQTDAAVNPGNSGGALVNARGELVGINTAIASNTGSYSGYSFAVPAEIVKKVLRDLMTHGVVQRAFLGIDMVELNGDVARKLDIESTQGVYVRGVSERGSARAAGIQEGDIFVELDGNKLRNAAELTEYVGRKRPGDAIWATILRDGQPVKVQIELRNYEGTTDIVRKPEAQTLESLGAEMEDLGAVELEELNLRGGVRITKLGNGKLRQFTDIRPGFIVTSLDNQAVEDLESLRALLSRKSGGVMIAGIYPDRPGLYYYAFGM
ncbi:MAG: trypsin-like peptidase domain-containing protein [Bacteroidota bacterium]